MKRSRLLGALCACLTCVIPFSSVNAQANEWYGYSPDWNDSTNWNLGVVPDSIADVEFGILASQNSSSPYVDLGFNQVIEVNSLSFTTNDVYSFDYGIATGSNTLSLTSGAMSSAVGSAQVFNNNIELLNTGNWMLDGDMVLVGSLVGGFDLYKNGTGSLTLAGDNSADTRAYNLDGGSLVLNGADAVSDSSTINMQTGTSLYIESIESIGALHGNGSVILNADLTTGLNNLDTFVSAIITGTGSFTKDGTGSLTLTAANTHSGGTNLNAGTLVLGNNNAAGTGNINIAGSNTVLGYGSGVDIGNAVVLNNNATLGVQSGSATQAGAISESGGSYGITKTGAGTLTLTGTNTYTGATNVSAGTLAVNNGGSVNSSSLTASGANTSVSTLGGGVLNLTGNMTLQDGAQANSYYGYVGATNENRTNVIYAGPSVTVTGNNTKWSTNELRVGDNGAGTLSISNGATVSSTGSTEVGTSTSSNGVLNINAGGTLNSGGGALLGLFDGSSGDVTVGGANALWDVTGTLHVGGTPMHAGGDGDVIVNSGGLVKATNVGIYSSLSSISTGPATISDGGVIDIAGMLTLQGGGSASSRYGITDNISSPSTFDHNAIISSEATVTGTGSIWNAESLLVGYEGIGTLTIADGATVTSNRIMIGVLNTSDGRLNINAGGTLNTGPYTDREIYVGREVGSVGTVTVGGTNALWDIGGTLNVGGSKGKSKEGWGVIDVGGKGDITVNNGGLIRVANLGVYSGTSSITTGTGGVIDVADSMYNAGTVINQGDISGAGTFTQTAGQTINDSTITFASVDLQGGLLAGNGTINGNVYNTGGTVGRSYSADRGPGADILTINGNYTMTENGTLHVNLGESGFGTYVDLLNVSGDAYLSGILDIDTVDYGYGLFEDSVFLGDTFDILFAENIYGEFDLLTLAVLGNGLGWDVSYLADEFGSTDIVRLTVVTSAVPIPAAIWLFGSGLLGLVGIARRKNVA